MTWSAALPWITTATGASVMWLAAHRRTRRAAWIVGLLNQAPWIAFAIVTRSWGFIPGSALYGGVYIRNLMRGDHR